MGKKRLAGIGLSTLRHPITHDVSMGQEYLPSHFPLFMWPFFISCTRWQSIHGASALSKYRFHLWKSLPSWFFKQKTNTASILLKKIFGLISTSHLSITNLNLCIGFNLAILRPPKPPSPKRSWLFNLACAMASVSKNMTPLRRVRSSFLPRLGNVAGLAQLRPELEILTAKIQKKKLPKGWFLNFHQIITTWTAWIFPGIKKLHDPFMAIYRTNQNVTVSCFFQKSGRQLKKNRNPPPTKKHVFGYSSILLKLVGQSRRMHTLTFFVHRSLSQVFVMVVVVPGNHGWDLPWDFGCPGNVWKLVCNKTSFIYLNLFWNWSLRQ